jgi:hypothetical protein
MSSRDTLRCAEPGQSDLWGIETVLNENGGNWGRHWEIETKATGKRPTPEQLVWLRNCTRMGAIAFWGDNVDTIRRVAQAILNGGRIVWRQGDDFDVEIPEGKE